MGRERLGKGKVEEKPGKETNMELERWRINRCQQKRKRSVSIIYYRSFQNRAEQSPGFEAKR